MRFADAVRSICEEPSILGRYGGPIKADVDAITAILQEFLPILSLEEQEEEEIDFVETIGTIINRIVQDEEQRQAIGHEIELIIDEIKPVSISDIVRAIDAVSYTHLPRTTTWQRTPSDRLWLGGRIGCSPATRRGHLSLIHI